MNRFAFPFLILLSLFSVIGIAFCGTKNLSKDTVVRVAIVREARTIDLEIDGQFIIRDGSSAKIILKDTRLARTTVRLLEKGFFIGGNIYAYKRMVIEPLRDASIMVNKHRFRGELVLIRTADNRITVVNGINIEDYIKGVLYHEVSHHWPMEALKAQAVAARTYAIYSLKNGGNKEFDVTNDIYSQVYGGRNSERYRTGLAVDRTSGEILTFKDKILPSYFHATCGGMTEDAKELWGIDLMPLKGVPCQFCLDSPHMHWKKNLQLKVLQEELNKRGFKIGPIKDITIVDRDRSDRINALKIIGRGGDEALIKGKDFREVVGPNILRSNNYDVQMQGYYVDFVGKGWGHGVGLCQWGARGMALQQFNYKQILNYYYPGAALVDYHDVRR